jgi:hypothetical protein
MASALFRDIEHYSDWETRIGGHLARALEASPHDPRALYWRGKLCWKLLQVDAAMDWWRKAAAAGSNKALLELALIAWDKDTDESRIEAIGLAMQSQIHGPAYDDRAELLVLWTAAMEAKVDRDTLNYARGVGLSLLAHLQKSNMALQPNVSSALNLIVAKLAHQAARGNGGAPVATGDSI